MKYLILIVLIITFFITSNAMGDTITMISPQNDVHITVIADDVKVNERIIVFQNIRSIKGSVSDHPEHKIAIRKEHERITVPPGYKIILRNE